MNVCRITKLECSHCNPCCEHRVVKYEKCKTCHWKYGDSQCICEDQIIFYSPTQYMSDCIGYLNENYTRDMMITHDRCVRILRDMNYTQLIKASELLSNIRKDDLNEKI